MRYAELTGSSTKPLPSHNPWSGGSNFCSKLVNWLSRLLTPSKLTRGELVAAAATAADAGAPGIISVAEKWPDGSRRPLSVPAPTAPRWPAPFWAPAGPPPVCRCTASQREPGYPPKPTPGPPSAPARLRSLPGPRPQPAHPCETGSPDHPSPEGRSPPEPSRQ